LLDQIRAVFDVIGPYIGMTLEEFTWANVVPTRANLLV
jgi:hypothetical protein